MCEYIIESQHKEIVKQNLDNTLFYNATVTCPCGWERAITKAYKCLYCDIYFCPVCAENHFGQTIQEYKLKKERNDE